MSLHDDVSGDGADRVDRGDGHAGPRGVVDRLLAGLGRARSRVPVDWRRVLALLGVLALLASLLGVLHGIVQVDPSPDPFWYLVIGALLGATLLARFVRVVVALSVSAVLLVGGLAIYVTSLPHDPQVLPMLVSNLELLSGKSLLQIERAEVWALSVTPAPVFVTWYLALRRWYATAVLAGSALLGYLVMTGDAGTTATLVAVIGAAAAVGFGDLERRDGTGAAAEYLAAILALMVIVPLVVTVVPGGSAAPLSLTGDDDATMEASLIDTTGDLEIQGAIDLSPDVRFTVEADEPRRWRVESFGRYAGDTWHRTGSARPLSDVTLSGPQGPADTLEQRVSVRSTMQVMPAAWRPIDAEGAAGETAWYTSGGGLRPAGTLSEGDTYEVRSAVPQPSAEDLVNTDRDYPSTLSNYTELPASTPDRVAERTDEIVGDTENPYAAATRIEEWLEANREYSLDVEKPDGSITDAFLFDMEQGYCVYYATAMATMLRTQDVPTRFVVGYTPGQELEDDRWLVRGYNAHAWVEVYFPDHGWVAFDPTPSEPRVDAEQGRLQTARDSGEEDVDAEESADVEGTPPPMSTPSGNMSDFGQINPGGLPGAGSEPTVSPPAGGGGAPVSIPDLPSREQLTLGAVVMIGAVAGLRRTGLDKRAYRSVWLRYQRRRDPERDVEGAYERVEYLLEREHGERGPGQTVRQYLDAIDADERARRVADLRERVHYGDGVTSAEADEAVDLARELVPGP